MPANIVSTIADPPAVGRKVIDIVCDQLGVSRDKVTPETHFINDLGADSLDTVELVMELEEEFDITIPEEAAKQIRNIREMVEGVQKLVDAK